MTSGPSKTNSQFKVKLSELDIAEIADLSFDHAYTPTIAKYAQAGAPIEDLNALRVILALSDFLRFRHCEPDFEIAISE